MLMVEMNFVFDIYPGWSLNLLLRCWKVSPLYMTRLAARRRHTE